MEIIPSNRGGSKLCYQGYMHAKHATRNTNQWWKCVKRSSTGCRGSLSTTIQNENPVPGQSHHYAPCDTTPNSEDSVGIYCIIKNAFLRAKMIF